MFPEQPHRSPAPSESERGLIPPTVDPYAFAQEIADIRIEQLKAYGVLRRAEEITDEWELDDHFDELAREYRAVCLFFGLAWPPLHY